MTKRIVVVLIGFLLLPPLAAWGQAPQEEGYLLTVTSVLPRFEASPFLTDDWLSEILEVNTASGEQTTALALWGPNAPAYPNLVRGPRWSPEGDRLAMVLLDRQGGEELALYNTNEQALYKVLTTAMGFRQISPPSWSPDGGAMVFSAAHGDDAQQVWQIVLPHEEAVILAEGSAPVFSPDGTRVAFLTPEGQIALYDLEGVRQTPLVNLPTATSLAWSPDGKWLAAAGATDVFLIEINSATLNGIFNALTHLALTETPTDLQLGSVTWSADSRALAFTLNLRGEADLGSLSQVIVLDVATQTAEAVLKRVYPAEAGATLSDDARMYIDAVFQHRGAFLPQSGNTTEF